MSWEGIVSEAQEIVSVDDFLEPLISHIVLKHASFSEALVAMLASHFAGIIEESRWSQLFATTHGIGSSCPPEYEPGKGSLEKLGLLDLIAVKIRDPACPNHLNPFLYFKGYKAIQAHRIAHVRSFFVCSKEESC